MERAASASVQRTSTKGSNPHRAAVLLWYRKILRAAFDVDWKTDADAGYVLDEARRLFRRNAHITDVALIERKLEEAETRYGLAVHYRIPYPRMYHHAQGSKPGSGVAYTPYLDSAYDGDEANPKFDMQPGARNSRQAAAVDGSGLGHLDFDNRDEEFGREKR